MNRSNFWVVLLAAIAVHAVLLEVFMAISIVIGLGRLTLPLLEMSGGDRISHAIEEVAIVFLLLMLYRLTDPAERDSRAGFRLGSYGGLLSYIMFALARYRFGAALGIVVYDFVIMGLSGGITGVVIARLLNRPDSAVPVEEPADAEDEASPAES